MFKNSPPIHFKLSIKTAVILCFSACFCFAEDKSAFWEKQYKDQSVIYLLAERILELKPDWSVEETKKTMYRIQKDSAKDEFGKVEIEYDERTQKLKDFEGYTITADGQKIPPHSVGSYEGKTVFIMQNVVPGSIIYYKSTLEKRPEIAATFCASFNFRFFFPYKALRYKLIIPSTVKVSMKSVNTDIKPRISEDENKRIYTWEKEFIDPFFPPEEFMPDFSEFYEHTMVSTIKDWKVYIDGIRNEYEKDIKKSVSVENVVKSLIKPEDKPEERIQKILAYVQQNFRYEQRNSAEKELGPRSLEVIFQNKFGVCSDYSIATVYLLRGAGIKAYSALYNSSDQGNPKNKLPGWVRYNHVIVVIDLNGKIYYVDPQMKGYRFNELPLSMQGAYLLVFKDKESYFDRIPILDESENFEYSETRQTLKKDGSFFIELSQLQTREDAIEQRLAWKDYTEKQKEDYLERIERTFAKKGKMLEMKFEGIENEYGPLSFVFKFETAFQYERAGDFIILGEGEFKGFAFKNKKRNYPVFYPANGLYKICNIYSIPEDFTIINLPKNIEITSPMAEFSRKYTKEKNVITETEIQRYKRMRLPVKDYFKMKDFFDQIPLLTNERILIKRNSVK